jgi:hypothetical protein
VVPALVLAACGPRRLGYRILCAALVVGLFGWWPVPIGKQGGYDPQAQLLPRGFLLLAPNRGNNRATVEFTWRGLELIIGNYYVLTLLVFIAATASALVLTRRLGPEPAQSVPEPGRANRVLNGRPGGRPGRGGRERDTPSCEPWTTVTARPAQIPDGLEFAWTCEDLNVGPLRWLRLPAGGRART